MERQPLLRHGAPRRVRAEIHMSAKSDHLDVRKPTTSKTAVEHIDFDYRIAWAKNYHDLFLSDFVKETSVSEVLEVIQTRGRVLLVGKAGSGKTRIAERLLNESVRHGIYAI